MEKALDMPLSIDALNLALRIRLLPDRVGGRSGIENEGGVTVSGGEGGGGNGTGAGGSGGAGAGGNWMGAGGAMAGRRSGDGSVTG